MSKVLMSKVHLLFHSPSRPIVRPSIENNREHIWDHNFTFSTWPNIHGSWPPHGLSYHMSLGTKFMPYVIYLWHIQKYVDHRLHMDLGHDTWGHGCLAMTHGPCKLGMDLGMVVHMLS